MTSTSGEEIVKAVAITIFTPENRKKFRQIHRAPPKQGFPEKGIEQLLAKTAEKIEQAYPGEDYGLVETGKASFNFVWRRHKAVEEPAQA